jgi:FlaA1/EpsC-like NDP-sugar epimerase
MILLYGNTKNIEIKVIGLAKGEKIHEELFDGFLEDTEHPKIKKCYEGSFNDLETDEFMIKLNDCLNLMDFDKLKLLLESRFRFNFR